jgi:hypothetical protein
MRPYMIRPPALDHDEGLVWTAGASRVMPTGLGRVVGGRLFVTTCRLVHRPGYIERLFWAKEWTCSLDDVERIGVGPRFTSAIGAFGQLMPIHLTGGHVETFRVWNASKFAARVNGARASVTLPGDGPGGG